jgi:hypothetical protein
MRPGLAQQRLVAVFLVATLLFVSPVVSIFDRAEPVFGVPLILPVPVRRLGRVIAAITWIVERGSAEPS